MAKLPSGPPMLTATLGFLRDPFGSWQKFAKQYGDPFTLRLPTLDPWVVTGNPKGIRQIFTAPSETFISSVTHAIPLMGSFSIHMLNGDRHKRERALMMPPFHGERMRAYGQLIQEIALQQFAGLEPDQSFAIQDRTQAISLKVIIKAIFGVDRSERVQEFEQVAPAYFQAFTPLLQFVPPLRRDLFGLSPWRHFQQTSTRFHQLLQAQIDELRGSGELGEDILSLLLSARDEAGNGMSDQELQDELKTLLIAGNVSTSTAMAWAFYWLHREPETLSRLQAELTALNTPLPHPQELLSLPYLTAVCEEALRLYPVTPGVGRKLRRPLQLLEYTLPSGVVVHPAIPLAHLNPELYPDPLRFQPERFLKSKPTPFEYLPFGGGMRRCIGAAFATAEMKIVLGTILSQHRFDLAESDLVTPVPKGAVVGPNTGIKMRYLGSAVPLVAP